MTEPRCLRKDMGKEPVQDEPCYMTCPDAMLCAMYQGYEEVSHG